MSDRFTSDEYSDRQIKAGGCVILGTIGILILAVLFFTFFRRVDAGEACVVTRFGDVTKVVSSGLSFRVPVMHKYHCYNTRLQSYETVEDQNPETDEIETRSQATHVDFLVDGKSVEGLEYRVSFIIQFQTPNESVRQLYDDKARNDNTVMEQIVKLHARAIVRQQLNTHTAEELYLGNLEQLSRDIQTRLAERFAADGVTLRYFELKKPDFQDDYEAAITQKALLVETTQQRVLEQNLATEEAERLRIEQEGLAAAVVIEAQGQADAVVIAANGEAEAIEVRGAALDANPSVLQWEQIQAIRDAGAIYLPSDTGILPILDLPTPEPEE